jgi:hypothetical protein
MHASASSSSNGHNNTGTASTTNSKKNDGSSSSTASPVLNHKELGSPGSMDDTTGGPAASRVSHIYDSDADDSGESSEDEHEIELNNMVNNTGSSNVNPDNNQGEASKSAKFFEKLANSSLMNRGLVKKIVNNVAATPIVLAVEIPGFFGTITINIPRYDV